MVDRPTLHLRSAAFVRAHRPDIPRAYTIQAAPRLDYGHGFDGTVPALVPHAGAWDLGRKLVRLRREGVDLGSGEAARSLAVYRRMVEDQFARHEAGGDLAPGRLWLRYETDVEVLRDNVVDADVLTCSCSIGEAREGRCHRSWAAPFLVRAGWRVLLDDVEVIRA